MLVLLAACVGLQAIPDDSGGAELSLGDLTLSQSAIDFGEVKVGDRVEQPITLSNVGANATKVRASVSDEAFEVDQAELTVLKGGEAVLVVGFSPENFQEYTGQLTVGAGGEQVTLPLLGVGADETADTDTGTDDTGSGSGGDLSTDQPSLAFGTLDLYASSMKSLTVENIGDAPLTISALSASDAAYALGGNLTPGRTLDPGESRVVEVTFTPTAEKAYNAELTLTSDDPDSPRTTITLSGTGHNECDYCSPVITVDTGGSSDYALQDFLSLFGSTDSRTISIGNDGDQDLEVRSIDVNNDFLATCGTFWLSSWSGSATVKPGKTTSFTVNYKATETCLDVAQLSLDANVIHILSNDPSEGDYVIEIGGTGVFL